jgi:hypothetical protein
MTLQNVAQETNSNLMRRAIQVDSLVSAISGVIVIAASGPLAVFMGLASPTILIVTGLFFLIYAAGLWQTAARNPLNRRLAYVPIVLNAIWVIGSVALLLTGWPALTAGGKWLIALVALVVAILAEVQFYGVRQH